MSASPTNRPPPGEAGPQAIAEPASQGPAADEQLRLAIDVAALHSVTLQDLFNSAEIGAILLDRELTFQLFTSVARQIFALTPADYGRPLGDIAHLLMDVDIVADARHVLASQETIEREVHAANARVYVLRALPFPAGEDRAGGVVLTLVGITELKRHEERQAYLLRLSDALRSSADAELIYAAVTSLAMEHSGADRCYYCEIEDGVALIRRDARRADFPSVAGAYPLSSLPAIKAIVDAGRPFVVDDAATSDILDEELRQLCIQQEVIAFIDVPVLKEGITAGVLCLTQRTPRAWTDLDLELAVETAERTWAAAERARTAELLRQSEARFRALVTANSYAIYRMSPDWSELLELDGRGFIASTTAPSTSWLEKYIDPEDQPSVMQAIHAAISARSLFELEHRVRRVDGSLGWTLSRAAPLLDERGMISEWFGAASDITARRQAEEAVRESEERFRSVFDAIDEGFCIAELLFDAAGQPVDYRFLLVNPAFPELTGLEAAPGQTALELVPGLEPFWVETYGRVALTGESVRFEHESQPMGRWFDVHASRVGGPESRRVAIVFTNITERKRVEAQAQAALAAERAARREAEAATQRTAQLQAVTAGLSHALTRDAVLRIITEHGAVATGASAVTVWLIDPAGEQLQIASKTGRGPSASARQPLRAPTPLALAARSGEPVWITSRDEAEARFPDLRKALGPFGDQALASLPLSSADAIIGTLNLAFAEPHSFSDAERIFLLALAQECALALERTRLYAEVLASQAQLRHLSRRLLAVQEEERSHIARELHDQLGQELTGLRLALELAGRVPPEQRDGHMAEARRTTQELIGRVRTLALDLRPAMLDDSGLLPALLWLIRRFRERTAISVELQHQGLDQRLPPAVETVAYRVVQEALTNVARHAGVSSATVTLMASPSRLLVQVEDRGQGFLQGDPHAAIASSGLAGMQERVALLGGTLSIESELGQGTWLTVDLPLGERPGH